MRNRRPIIGFQIEIVVEPDEGTYHAFCPALKGLHTCGDTEQEALQNAKDAAIAYIQSLVKHGDSIPVGVTMRAEGELKVHSLAIYSSHHTEDLKVTCSI